MEEVICDKGEAQRSQATGFLTVTVPKLNPEEVIAPPPLINNCKNDPKSGKKQQDDTMLEVLDDCLDFSRIVQRPDSTSPPPLEDVE